MTTREDAVTRQLADGRPTRVAESADREVIPPRWLPIFDAATPADRVNTALALWKSGTGKSGTGKSGMSSIIPRFWATLRDDLVDVRVGLQDDGAPVLIYTVERSTDSRAAGSDTVTAVWIGHDVAAGNQVRPADDLWGAVPESIREFYGSVHASFTAPDERTFGFVNPASMVTLAQALGQPDGVLDWEEDPDSTRLLVLAQTASGVRLCVSPDLPSGFGQEVYQQDEPDPPEELPGLIDHILHVRFEVE